MSKSLSEICLVINSSCPDCGYKLDWPHWWCVVRVNFSCVYHNRTHAHTLTLSQQQQQQQQQQPHTQHPRCKSWLHSRWLAPTVLKREEESETRWNGESHTRPDRTHSTRMQTHGRTQSVHHLSPSFLFAGNTTHTTHTHYTLSQHQAPLRKRERERE